MACCAIAFFLISQILWPFRWIRARMSIAVPNDAVSWSLEDAVSWSLENAPAPRPALASTGALVLAAALMLGSLTQLSAAHPHFCTTHVARGN